MTKEQIRARTPCVVVRGKPNGTMGVHDIGDQENMGQPVLDMLWLLFAQIVSTLRYRPVDICLYDTLTIRIVPETDGVTLAYKAECDVRRGHDPRPLVGGNTCCGTCVMRKHDEEGALHCMSGKNPGDSPMDGPVVEPCQPACWLYLWDGKTTLSEPAITVYDFTKE